MIISLNSQCIGMDRFGSPLVQYKDLKQKIIQDHSFELNWGIGLGLMDEGGREM
jgi:hypothetical protein